MDQGQFDLPRESQGFRNVFMMLLLPSLILISSTLALQAQIPLSQPLHSSSSIALASENGNHVFSALHSSMRQWGSSLKYNGMSIFLASIPAGTMLYHGSRAGNVPVRGMEWLAFEIEHAEVFARSRRRHQGEPQPPTPPESRRDGERYADDVPDDVPASLHMYRTKHALNNVLYIDGMAAGKTTMGTLDTQDYLLLNGNSDPDPRKDYARANALCEEWGIEAFVRMEAGFELIVCNFTESVDFVSATQRPDFDDPAYNDLGSFEYIRGVSLRYQGITAGRVQVDYSSMISAYFYQINLTNPEPGNSLPRLVSADQKQLARIKSDVSKALSSPRQASIDWQGVVDMVVTRYSDRLQFLVQDSTTPENFQAEINFLLNTFIDYSSPEIDESSALSRCSAHYLQVVQPSSSADYLIHASVHRVTEEICAVLFTARAAGAEAGGRSAVRKLIAWLDWSTWRQCGKCAYDEVCFVPVWPFGGVQDYEHPSCVPRGELETHHGYWGGNW